MIGRLARHMSATGWADTQPAGTLPFQSRSAVLDAFLAACGIHPSPAVFTSSCTPCPPRTLRRTAYKMVQNLNRSLKMLTDAAVAEQMSAMVRAAIARRSGERGREGAIAMLARHLGMSTRRVTSYYYRGVRKPLASEYVTVCDRLEAWLDEDRARLEAEKARLLAARTIAAGAGFETDETAAAPGVAKGGMAGASSAEG